MIYPKNKNLDIDHENKGINNKSDNYQVYNLIFYFITDYLKNIKIIENTYITCMNSSNHTSSIYIIVSSQSDACIKSDLESDDDIKSEPESDATGNGSALSLL